VSRTKRRRSRKKRQVKGKRRRRKRGGREKGLCFSQNSCFEFFLSK
jgi:hypothetical protein